MTTKEFNNTSFTAKMSFIAPDGKTEYPLKAVDFEKMLFGTFVLVYKILWFDAKQCQLIKAKQ